MGILSVGALYVGLHCVVYMGLVHKLRWRPSERAIFVYHALSFLAFLLYLVVRENVAQDLLIVAGALAIHAIYSVSFLELWSLSEGSYSLSILSAADRRPLGQADLENLARIGNMKRTTRLDSLARLALVHITDGKAALTLKGRVAARCLAGVRFLARVKSAG